jgi:hypothetical protein
MFSIQMCLSFFWRIMQSTVWWAKDWRIYLRESSRVHSASNSSIQLHPTASRAFIKSVLSSHYETTGNIHHAMVFLYSLHTDMYTKLYRSYLPCMYIVIHLVLSWISFICSKSNQNPIKSNFICHIHMVSGCYCECSEMLVLLVPTML